MTASSLCCWTTRPIDPEYDFVGQLKRCRKLRIAKNRELHGLKQLGLFRQDPKKPQHKIKIKGNQC